MAIVLRELGDGATVYSPFTSAASGTDYVSNYDPNDDYVAITGSGAPLTGAIGDSFSRPILYSYIQLYSTAGGAGTIDLQIAEADDGVGGSANYSVPIGTANNDWNIADAADGLAYPTFARENVGGVDTNIRHYYGFQKNDSNTYTFRRAATLSSAYNPNGIYQDGTSVTTGTPGWNTTAIKGRVRFYTVPTEPNSFTNTLYLTASSIPLTWAAPTDSGASTNLAETSTIYTHHNVYGYRILTSTDNVSWYVYGTGTTGSPSGTHDIAFGTGTPSAPTSATITSHNNVALVSNTNYYFKIAALNVTTDAHAGATVTPFASRGFGAYTSNGSHTGTNASLGAVRTRIASPTTSGSYTATGNIGITYSSNITWGTPSGGNAVTPTWTYAVASGALPTGLSLNTSTGAITGTPSASGTFTFTISLSNQDYDATYYTSGRVTTATQTVTITSGPKVFNGTSFVRGTAKVWNGSAWVAATTKVYDGATWKDMS
jgi:hypothetical protein